MCDRMELDNRLARLRRLYHHVLQGGKTTEQDFALVGRTPDPQNLSTLIRRLEGQQRKADTPPVEKC